MRRPAFLATSVLLPACILAGFVVVPTCSARVVTVKFTATITKVSVSPPGGELTDDARLMAQSFKVGDLVEGVYAYDTSAPDLSAYDWSGGYQFAARPCGIALSTSGFVFKTDPEAVSVTVGTTNDLRPIVHGLPGEEFGMASKNNLMTPQTGDFRCQAISLDLGALWPHDPLNDDSLPILAPALEDWDIRRLTFGVYHGQQQPRVGWGSFESVAVEAVLTRVELLPDPAWVLYVDAGATAGGDGQSWPTAYASLQDALASAPTVGNTEIRVAQGTYRPDQGAGIQSGDRDATFRLLNGVTIRGGYAGLSQPDPNAWDPASYETILHGDLQDNDDYPNQASLYDNSSHIVTSVGVDETAVLDGFTITQGACFGTGSRTSIDLSQGGAGLYNESGAPIIRRCVFLRNFNNDLGSAVLNHTGSAARFEDCTFEENYYMAALTDYQSHSVLQGCRFVKNHSNGISQYASTCEIDDCEFVENRSTAVALDSGSSARISDCVFIANNRAIGGSQVECRGCVFERNTDNNDSGAVRIGRGSFVDCLFRGNSSETGGAVRAGSLELQRCVFVQNSARNEGAVSCVEAVIHQCLFAGNQATRSFGALFIRKGATISNCTFVGNRSAFNGIIYAVQATEPGVMTNCIFKDNVCFEEYMALIQPNSLMTVRYSNISDPYGWYKVRGEAIMDIDPLFADPGHWDPNGTPDDLSDDFWVEGDYHLKSQAGRWDPTSESWVLDDVTSPCIDAGDPNSPVADEPEPNGGRVNMGAYGGTAEASKSPGRP